MSAAQSRKHSDVTPDNGFTTVTIGSSPLPREAPSRHRCRPATAAAPRRELGVPLERDLDRRDGDGPMGLRQWGDRVPTRIMRCRHGNWLIREERD